MSNDSHRHIVVILSALILIAIICVPWLEGTAFGVKGQPVSTGTAELEASPAVSPIQADCRELAAMLDQHTTQISRELGQVRREIAALREDMTNPGIKEIFAGIGYIFGLAGVGFFVHSHRDRR